ncbi:MAG: response regulator [Bacteroidota bacterium]
MKHHLFCLLIDDDEEDRDIFLMALNRLDPTIDLDYAVNGEEALKRLKSYRSRLPDYIFLDLNMQVMNGKECLTEIKKLPEISEIPVIIYSTSLNEKTIYDTLLLGAFDHIEKPTRVGALDEYLRRVFQIEAGPLR